MLYICYLLVEFSEWVFAAVCVNTHLLVQLSFVFCHIIVEFCYFFCNQFIMFSHWSQWVSKIFDFFSYQFYLGQCSGFYLLMLGLWELNFIFLFSYYFLLWFTIFSIFVLISSNTVSLFCDLCKRNSISSMTLLWASTSLLNPVTVSLSWSPLKYYLVSYLSMVGSTRSRTSCLIFVSNANQFSSNAFLFSTTN